MFRTSQCQDVVEVLKFKNEDVRELKDALGNLNTRKNTSTRILTGIVSANSETCELRPKFVFKIFSAWSFRGDKELKKT